MLADVCEVRGLWYGFVQSPSGTWVPLDLEEDETEAQVVAKLIELGFTMKDGLT